MARRIFDSLTPGWQQVGAVWLPLPHVLNAIPVQVDAWYRSGASGTAISVLAMALAAWSLARILALTTGSFVAAIAGAAVMLGNPNILYLTATPMTEPLLIGTVLFAIATIADWIIKDAPLPARAPGWALIAACMTRYEAYPIAAAILAATLLILMRRGMPVRAALERSIRLGLYPLVAFIIFSANSRWTTGTWFIPPGFFVPENKALGDSMLAFEQVRESVYLLSGSAVVWPAYVAMVLVVYTFVRSKSRAPLLLLLAMLAASAIPWYAYYQGHPLRVRYGLPLVAACAAISAGGIGILWAPLRPIAAALLVAWTLTQNRPIDHYVPMVLEAQRDAQNMEGRRAVTAYLRQHWDGDTIMMSMGSLAHYMHDLSREGFEIHDFLHEGNDEIWQHAAFVGPRGFVRWVVIEERAEGGDALLSAVKRDARWLDGFARVAEGGGVALYRAR